MVVTDIKKTNEISLKELIKNNPEYTDFLLDALELLMFENEFLRKIASRYSHDLRSPVTNIDMLLQLYEKAEKSPDKELYINKMIRSIKQLQTGFEELSAERKSVLFKSEGLHEAFLDEIMGEVKTKLPKNIALSTDFSDGKKAKCNSQTLYDCLLLLLSPFAEYNGIHTIEINSKKSWNGLMLNIIYPEFLNLLNLEPLDKNTTIDKNAPSNNQILGWNYYFATLFLRTMGATVSVHESLDEQTTVQISFTQ